LNIWLQRFIFSGYLIHVIDDVIFSSAKIHLLTDNLIVAIRSPRTFLKPSRASGQPISESLVYSPSMLYIKINHTGGIHLRSTVCALSLPVPVSSSNYGLHTPHRRL
jgi:hypothetical protein